MCIYTPYKFLGAQVGLLIKMPSDQQPSAWDMLVMAVHVPKYL